MSAEGELAPSPSTLRAKSEEGGQRCRRGKESGGGRVFEEEEVEEEDEEDKVGERDRK